MPATVSGGTTELTPPPVYGGGLVSGGWLTYGGWLAYGGWLVVRGRSAGLVQLGQVILA